MTVRRNAFGRQVDSFEGDIAFEGLDGPAHAVFIRAPWVERVGPGVRVLARAQDHIVAVSLPPEIHLLCVDKGSLAIDGISLTIAELTGPEP